MALTTPQQASDQRKRQVALAALKRGELVQLLAEVDARRLDMADQSPSTRRSDQGANGIDQRLLDSWLGHTTEIRKRYLHLIPSNEQTATQGVFGAPQVARIS